MGGIAGLAGWLAGLTGHGGWAALLDGTGWWLVFLCQLCEGQELSDVRGFT